MLVAFGYSASSKSLCAVPASPSPPFASACMLTYSCCFSLAENYIICTCRRSKTLTTALDVGEDAESRGLSRGRLCELCQMTIDIWSAQAESILFAVIGSISATSLSGRSKATACTESRSTGRRHFGCRFGLLPYRWRGAQIRATEWGWSVFVTTQNEAGRSTSRWSRSRRDPRPQFWSNEEESATGRVRTYQAASTECSSPTTTQSCPKPTGSATEEASVH